MAPDCGLHPDSRLLQQAPTARPGAGQRAAGKAWRYDTLSLLLAGAVLAVMPAFAQDEVAFEALDARLDTLYRDLPGPIHYFVKQVDLNSDKRPEFIVHVAGPMVCGTGGCDTLVFTEGDDGLRLMASIPVTRPPIAVAETATNGWHDLIVHVSGGGILPGHDSRLRFDGSTYPQNPTVEPAEALEQPAQGMVAIPEFESFREGRSLRAAPE